MYIGGGQQLDRLTGIGGLGQSLLGGLGVGLVKVLLARVGRPLSVLGVAKVGIDVEELLLAIGGKSGRLAVDSHEGALADLLVGENALVHVEEGGQNAGVMGVELDVVVAVEVVVVLSGDLASDIVLAGLKPAHARGGLGHELIVDVLGGRGDLAGVARSLAVGGDIILVAGEMDVLVLLPLHQLVGTGTHVLGHAGIARGLDDLGGEDTRILGVVAQDDQKVDGGLGQRAGDLVVARDGEGGAGQQARGAVVDGEPAVHRGHDVLGAKLLAVVEGDALAQLDGVGQAVVGDLIALGQHGLGLAVAIEAKERLDDVADDVHGHKRRRGVRIETVRARR